MSERKYDGIDIMKLYSKGSANGWNEFLEKCYANNDINLLAKTSYRLAVGMTDMAKAKLNTAEIDNTFCRWMRSLDITARKIIKKMYPMPGDTLDKEGFDSLTKSHKEKILTAKRSRDRALADYMKKSRF